MTRRVTHLITYKATIFGTATVTCDECEHHPEKLACDDVQWNLDSLENIEVVDGDIIDAYEDHEVVNTADSCAPDQRPLAEDSLANDPTASVMPDDWPF